MLFCWFKTIKCHSYTTNHTHIRAVCSAAYPTTAYLCMPAALPDLDECISELLHNCTASFMCVNTAGNYRCECAPGMAYIPEEKICEGNGG